MYVHVDVCKYMRVCTYMRMCTCVCVCVRACVRVERGHLQRLDIASDQASRVYITTDAPVTNNKRMYTWHVCVCVCVCY